MLMNPLLNVLSSIPTGTAQGVTDAADAPNRGGGTFAQLLGQFTPSSTITTAEPDDEAGIEKPAGANGNSTLLVLPTVTPGDGSVPGVAEQEPGVSASDANLVTGLLEHMLAAATMQPSPQPPAPIESANSPLAETAPPDSPAVARAIAMSISETHDADAQFAKAMVISAPATPLAAAAAGMETASNTPMPMPLSQVLDAAPTKSGAHFASIAGAIPESSNLASINPMSGNTSGGLAPSDSPRPPEATLTSARPGDDLQTQAVLREPATLDHGINARGSATARDSALPGAPQSLLDLVRQMPVRDDALAVTQGLAPPIPSDDIPNGAAGSYTRETLAGIATAGLSRTHSNTHALGYADPRERSDEFAIPASATVPSLMRGDMLTTVNIAPRMDTPEWQPAFARSVKMLVSDGTPAASLQLNPAEFGPIEVRIVINDRRADISFLVTNPNADAALQSALPELRDQLARSGIQLGQTSVGTQAQDQRQPANTPRREPAANLANAPAAGPVLPSRPRSTSQIDTFA